jgi:hypoxanthine-DNA glycosylase
MVFHPISPLYDENSKILILGSFPSVKSRESEFFYAHPQNRFWKVISCVFDEVVPRFVEEKKAFLAKHGIALWDVIASCEIEGSADSSIKSVTPNDLSKILDKARIKAIFTNGKTAKKYYDKYIGSTVGIEAYPLPSTSPANATQSLEKLIEQWRIISEI